MNKEEIDKKISDLWDEIHELQDQKLQLELEGTPDIEGKYLRIDDDFGWEVYLYCYSSFPSGQDMIIRGLGFRWEITPYWDATSMFCSWGYDITKPKRDYSDFVKKKITIISKEEFIEKYKTMVNDYSIKFDEIIKEHCE